VFGKVSSSRPPRARLTFLLVQLARATQRECFHSLRETPLAPLQRAPPCKPGVSVPRASAGSSQPVLLLARVNSDCDALSNFRSDLKARREKITRYNPTCHPRAILSPTSIGLRASLGHRRSCRLGKLQTMPTTIRPVSLIRLLYAESLECESQSATRACNRKIKRHKNISGKKKVDFA